jgi:hypothetical protein
MTAEQWAALLSLIRADHHAGIISAVGERDIRGQDDSPHLGEDHALGRLADAFARWHSSCTCTGYSTTN